MIQSVFSFIAKIFVTIFCCKLTSVGENPTYFRTFSTGRKGASDGKKEGF